MSKDESSEHAPREDRPGSPFWTYRGVELRPSEFATAMVHFYRGEVSRSNTWRARLDTTTNWAVVTTAAVLTFAFGTPEHTHAIILLSMSLLWIFLIIEARRYRYYELWALRVRLMETDFFAPMLVPPSRPHEEWAPRLVDSLLSPRFPISFWEAIGRRLRRNFIWLFLVLGVAWNVKLLLHPLPARSVEEFFSHAQLGFLPGKVVFWLVIAGFAGVLLLAFMTAGLRASPGEVLSRPELLGIPGDILHGLARAAGKFPLVHRHEQLAIIITEKPREVADQVLSILKRGVTGVEGVGMYSGKPRSLLFSAIAPAEISRLRAAVYSADQGAFLVVNPTEEVRGAGFGDLRPDWRKPRSEKAPKP